MELLKQHRTVKSGSDGSAADQIQMLRCDYLSYSLMFICAVLVKGSHLDNSE